MGTGGLDAAVTNLARTLRISEATSVSELGCGTFIADGCSAQRLERAEDFFGQAENQVPGTTEQLAKVAERVRDCVRLREREGAAAARYLASPP